MTEIRRYGSPFFFSIFEKKQNEHQVFTCRNLRPFLPNTFLSGQNQHSLVQAAGRGLERGPACR